jgi:hypothetical protein
MMGRFRSERRTPGPGPRAAGAAVALALCALLPAPARSEGPRPSPARDAAPVVVGPIAACLSWELAEDLYAEGRLLAHLTLGVAADPRTGPLSALVALRAGETRERFDRVEVIGGRRVRVYVPDPVWRVGERVVESREPDPEPLGPPRDEAAPADGKLPVIPDELVNKVRDDVPIPDLGSGDQEVDAYVTFLKLAARTDNKRFEEAAPNEANYAQLYETPKAVRGQVFRVKGRLKLLREAPAPPQVARDTGFGKVYEGWLVTDSHVPRLVCVFFVELPGGLTTGDKLDVPVEFCGYYFKRYGNESAPTLKSGEPSLAPLLIGRTITVKEESAITPMDWARGLLPLFLLMLVGTAAGLAALMLWFRRSDARVRRRLEAVRAAGMEAFLAAPPPPVPVAAPVQPPVAQPVPRPEALPPAAGGNGQPAPPRPAAPAEPADPEAGPPAAGPT